MSFVKRKLKIGNGMMGWVVAIIVVAGIAVILARRGGINVPILTQASEKLLG